MRIRDFQLLSSSIYRSIQTPFSVQERAETRLSSITTVSSQYSAPACSKSARIVGQHMISCPSSTPDSDSTCGPWHVTATDFSSKKCCKSLSYRIDLDPRPPGISSPPYSSGLMLAKVICASALYPWRTIYVLPSSMMSWISPSIVLTSEAATVALTTSSALSLKRGSTTPDSQIRLLRWQVSPALAQTRIPHLNMYIYGSK